MKSVSLIIIDKISPSQVLEKLQSFDFSQLNVSIILLSHDSNLEGIKGQWQHDEKINYHIFPFPEDEFCFKDLLQFDDSEYVCFYNPSLYYPSDYFQRTINKKLSNQDGRPVNRIGSVLERTIKASQQSKYGLGVLKKDIQRDFSFLKYSYIYLREQLKSANILEKNVDEDLPKEIFLWADKNKVKSEIYHPNYKKIEYFRDLGSYVSEIRKDAPYLRFKENKDASGLPLYILILVWLSLFSAFVFPAGILIFLVVSAVYSLAISLEALAISTLKRQGELFIGLLLFLPFLHHIYLFSYFSNLIAGKKHD